MLQLEHWVANLVRAEVERRLANASVEQPYMTTAEAAQFARVASGTIRRWMREGRIQGHGAGREVRLLRADLEQLMARGFRRQPGRPTAPRGRVLSPEQQALADLGLDT